MQQSPKDLAPQVLAAATRFMAAALEAFRGAYPEQLAALVEAGARFETRVQNVAAQPRVVVVALVEGRELELAHSELERVTPTLN